MGSVKKRSIYLFIYLFIIFYNYLFTSFAKRPGKLTEQTPPRGPEKKNSRLYYILTYYYRDKTAVLGAIKAQLAFSAR